MSLSTGNYTISNTLESIPFGDAVERTRKALQGEGFGVLTEIDVKKTMKAKIGAEMGDYLILGACNPEMAHKALQLEPQVGAMLPCNVIVRSIGDGDVEVSAVDPVASMAVIDNPELKRVAGVVREKLRKVVESL